MRGRFAYPSLALALSAALLSAILLTPLLAATAQPQLTQVIIGFNTAPDVGLVSAHGGQIKYTYSYVNAIAVSLPLGAIGALQKNPNVAYVEPDGVVEVIPLNSTTEQPPQTTPWGISKVRGPDVWAAFGNRGTGIKVAIVDTGIDLKHPDLKVVGGATFVRGTRSSNDDNGHGTHVAGTVAALDNTIGVVGVAPEAALFAVKVLNKNGFGFLSDVVKGIEWTIANGMQVNNYSWGTSSDSPTLHNVIIAALNAGIVQVAAAGNSGPGENTLLFPAKYLEVIATGATDINDNVASFSSRGPELDVVAPGVDILSTFKGQTYKTLSGTSMAAPHATGTVALIKVSSPGLDFDGVRTLLMNSAIDLALKGFDTSSGCGRIDALNAVSNTTTHLCA